MSTPVSVRLAQVPIRDHYNRPIGEYLAILCQQEGTNVVGWTYWRKQRIGVIYLKGISEGFTLEVHGQPGGPETSKRFCCVTCAANYLLREYTTARLQHIELTPSDWELSEALYGRR